MRSQEPENSSAEPIAIYVTWTTYGTWLPGDPRGWVLHGQGRKEPHAKKLRQSKNMLKEELVFLDDEQRECVEKAIKDHCKFRNWQELRSSCRTNHVHTVVAAPGVHPKIVRQQIKGWASRELNKLQATRNMPNRKNWWTEKGWIVKIDDDDQLENILRYVDEQ